MGLKRQNLMENWIYVKCILKIPESLKRKLPNFRKPKLKINLH